LATVVLSAVIVLPALTPPAAADPISDAQNQESRLVAQIAHMGTRIHQLTQTYDAASQRADVAATEVGQDRTKLESTQRDVDSSRSLLRRQGVDAYTFNISGTAGSHVTTGNPAVDLLVRREYLSVATGTVGDTIDRLRVDLATLRSWGDILRAQQSVEIRAAEQAAAARGAALAEATRAEGALAQVRGRLSTLIAQAQAAQAAEAAQARAAATAAAARQAAAAAARALAARASTATVARAAPAVTQGLPVSGGLLSAVRTQLSAPAPPPPPPPAPRPPAAPSPAAPPPPPPAPPPPGGGAGGVWAALRQCESGGNYAENTGNGFYGAYQFAQATWTGLGYPGRPDLEPPAMQDAAAQKLQALSGWGQWPACAAALGLL
jgi:hypothetical protein